jgi:hypothetical protein
MAAATKHLVALLITALEAAAELAQVGQTVHQAEVGQEVLEFKALLTLRLMVVLAQEDLHPLDIMLVAVAGLL